ncbi:MAG: hypothetical protein ACLR8R_10195 [Oscillospiraceae bacterium]
MAEMTKKCDLIYVDQDTGVAVVAQGYMKQTPKEANLAPGNKASDLNTAATWVFAQNPDEVPEQIREQVRLLSPPLKIILLVPSIFGMFTI